MRDVTSNGGVATECHPYNWLCYIPQVIRLALIVLSGILSLSIVTSAQTPPAKTADDYVREAVPLQRAGKHEDALQLLAANYALGTALQGLGKNAQAIEPLKRAIEAKKDWAFRSQVCARALNRKRQSIRCRRSFITASQRNA